MCDQCKTCKVRFSHRSLTHSVPIGRISLETGFVDTAQSRMKWALVMLMMFETEREREGG